MGRGSETRNKDHASRFDADAVLGFKYCVYRSTRKEAGENGGRKKKVERRGKRHVLVPLLPPFIMSYVARIKQTLNNQYMQFFPS
jgi:hypothetical protein